MARNIEVDVAVLGGGSAGMAAYRAATKAGASVVLIEHHEFGTTCARVGCMPSKLLIAAAEAAHAQQTAPAFGLPAVAPMPWDGRVDVMARVRRERDRFVGFVVREVEGYPRADTLLGAVRIAGDHAINVTAPDEATVRVRAARIVIATGSSPAVPEELAEVRALCLTTDALFELAQLPRSAAIVGTGVVALELGQALHRLGVRVRLFGRGGRLGVLTDPALLPIALEALQVELPLVHDALARFSRQGDQVRVDYLDAQGNPAEEGFDCVIAAAGRTPNLQLDGVEATSWGALLADVRESVDPATLRLGHTHVFVAGDATGGASIQHEAVDEGRIAGLNAARFPDLRPGLRRAALSIAFSAPQMASVGGGWRQARELGAVRVGRVSFENQGRSRVMLRNHGALHVYADGQGRFLGAETIGPEAEHLGHLMAWALQAQMSVEQMLAMPYYHPTVTEGLRTALQQLRTHK